MKLNGKMGFAFALAAALWVPSRLHAGGPQVSVGTDQTGAFNVNTNQTNTLQLLDQFFALREKMQADQDAELRQLLTQLNSAPQDKKLDAAVAIVNKLVEQRLAKDQRRQLVERRVLQELIQELGGTATTDTTNATMQTFPSGTSSTVPGGTQSSPSPTPG